MNEEGPIMGPLIMLEEQLKKHNAPDWMHKVAKRAQFVVEDQGEEIEQLRADLGTVRHAELAALLETDKLRAALREIQVSLSPDLQNECPRKAYMIAQEALGDGQHS